MAPVCLLPRIQAAKTEFGDTVLSTTTNSSPPVKHLCILAHSRRFDYLPLMPRIEHGLVCVPSKHYRQPAERAGRRIFVIDSPKTGRQHSHLTYPCLIYMYVQYCTGALR
jgi:hypothetical protein